MANKNKQYMRECAIRKSQKNIVAAPQYKKKVGKKITSVQLRSVFGLKGESASRCVCEGARPRFVRVGRK